MKSFFKKNKKFLGLAILAGFFLATPALADRTSNWWDRAGSILHPNFSGAALQVPGTPGGVGCLQIDGLGNITSSGAGCTALAGGMNIGAPVGGSTPNSILDVDGAGNLGQTTPLVANTFLKWNGAAFVWTATPTTIAIGSTVTGGTDPSILYIDGGLLAEDPTEFSFNPQGLFHAQITDAGATYNSDISASPLNIALVENNITTGRAEVLSLDGVRGFNLSSSLGLVASGINGSPTLTTVSSTDGTEGTSGAFASTNYDIRYMNNSFTPIISQTYGDANVNYSKYSDQSTGVISLSELTASHNQGEWTDGAGTVATSILDATQVDLRYINALSQTSFFHGDNTQAVMRLDDPSALSQTYNLLLPASNTMRWRLTPPNSSNGIVNIDGGALMTYLNFSDGMGSTGSLVATASNLTTEWTDSANLDMTSVLSASGSLTTASDAGSGFSSSALIDPNQYIIKSDNGAGTVARTIGNVSGALLDWSSTTLASTVGVSSSGVIGQFANLVSNNSGLLTLDNTNSFIRYTDGTTGNASQGLYNGTHFESNFIDANAYNSQDYGAADQTYQYYTTPYQLYSDETFTYVQGDTLNDVDSGATCDVQADNGTGVIVCTNVVGVFSSGDTIDDGLGNQSLLTTDGGTFSALHGVGQDVVPSGRYAMFLQTVTTGGVNARYEISDPSQVIFNTPSLTSSNALINFTKNQNNLSTHTFSNTTSGTSSGIQTIYYNGLSQFMVGLIGQGNTFGGVFTPSTVRFDNTQGDLAYIAGNSAKSHIFTVGGFALANQIMNITSAGVGISGSASSKVTAPSAYLELGAGTTSASTAPLKFRSGSLLSSPEIGAMEFLTDKWYGTITTGTARKEFTLNDAALTPGTIPVATTNGRLTDSTFTATTLVSGTFTPTPTGVTNITAVTANGGNYIRVGNQVTGEFQIVVDPTTTLTFTEYRVALPVASNFSAANQAGGACHSGTAAESQQILSEATNDEMLVWATPVNVTSQTYSCSYSYTVI